MHDFLSLPSHALFSIHMTHLVYLPSATCRNPVSTSWSSAISNHLSALEVGCQRALLCPWMSVLQAKYAWSVAQRSRAGSQKCYYSAASQPDRKRLCTPQADGTSPLSIPVPITVARAHSAVPSFLILSFFLHRKCSGPSDIVETWALPTGEDEKILNSLRTQAP